VRSWTITSPDLGGHGHVWQGANALVLACRLKDVVAHHQMDRAKLAMKWQTPERLIDLIVTQTKSRAHKGEAFLG
jgi:hypothetical protein